MTLWQKISAAMVATFLLGACTDAVDVAALHDRTLTLDTHIDIPLTYMKEIDPSGATDLKHALMR